MTFETNINSNEAKKSILEYCLKKGALIAGVADIDIVNRIAPEGHRPSDLWPRAKNRSFHLVWADKPRALGLFLPRRSDTSVRLKSAHIQLRMVLLFT